MNRNNPAIHNRRSIRLPGYDYTRVGEYYVTIVAWKRECLFGEMVNGVMIINQFGRIVEHAWFDLPNHYPNVGLDIFCIMPNHVHGIIKLVDDENVGAGLRPAPTDLALTTTKPNPTTETPIKHPLSEIVRAFKSFSARGINSLRGTHGTPVWQRNYYEHVIRNNADYLASSDYIMKNPSNWERDNENEKR